MSKAGLQFTVEMFNDTATGAGTVHLLPSSSTGITFSNSGISGDSLTLEATNFGTEATPTGWETIHTFVAGESVEVSAKYRFWRINKASGASATIIRATGDAS